MLLLFAFWLLCDFFLLSVWQKTAQPLRSSFLLQGAIDRLFLATTWEMYPLRFQVQISRIQRQNQFSSSRFLMLVTGQKLLASEQIKYFSFFSYFVGTWKQDQEFIRLKKISMKYHWKVKSKYYLFIYIYLFIYLFIYSFFLWHGPFCFFYNSNLGPHLLPTQGGLTEHNFGFFAFSRESSNMAPTRSTFPTEFSSNPNQTHPSMLIKFFRIFRKPQVGELDQGWSLKSCSAFAPPFQYSRRNPDLFIYEWKEGLVDMLFCFFTVEW